MSMFSVLSMLPLSTNFLIHIRIVFATETVLLRGIMTLPKITVTDLLFSKYAHTENPQCSPVQTVVH